MLEGFDHLPHKGVPSCAVRLVALPIRRYFLRTRWAQPGALFLKADDKERKTADVYVSGVDNLFADRTFQSLDLMLDKALRR